MTTDRLAWVSPARSGLSFTLLSVALAGAIFFFDYTLPLGVAGGVPYVALVLLGAWSPHRYALIALAAVSTVLVVLGYAVSPEGGELWKVVANRVLALFAIWVTALLLFERRGLDDALKEANANLERRVAERTAEFETANRSLRSEIERRTQAEQSLRESEARYRLVTDSLPSLISYIDKDLRYRYVNKAYSEWFGIAPDEILGKPIDEIVGDAAYAIIEPHHQRTLAGEFQRWEQELPYSHGGHRFVQSVHVPDRDKNGVVIGFHSLVTDITERKKAEEILRDANDELEARVAARTAELETANLQLRAEVAERERVSEALRRSETMLLMAQRLVKVDYWTQTEIGVATTVNSQWLAPSFGVEAGKDFDLSDEEYLEFVHPEDRERVADTYERQWADQGAYDIEYRLIAPDGRARYVHDIASTAAVAENGRPMVIGTLQDITESKQIEQQLIQASKLATLGEMSAGLAHEINQPLNVIRMAADSCLMLKEEGEINSEFQSDQLEIISGQAQRMTEIVDHMRVFGRVDSGEVIAFDPAESVRAAIAMVAEQCRAEGIGVEAALPERPRFVRGRPIRLEQVLLNLLSNARDAVVEAAGDGAPENGAMGDIFVELADDGEADTLGIAVSDTGGGIPDDLLDRIFDPFFTTKEVGSGTGLGLSISYGIIAEMGGRISASNGAVGARLEISLPVAEVDGN
jgi:PAS domain S-box-containing protein